MATSPSEAGHSAPLHYEGMPQLDPAFWPNLIFWLVITMVVLYFLMSKVALPRIAGIMRDRHQTVANDLEQAAELKRKAEEAEAAYDKALAEARAEAQKIAAETKAKINEDLAEATAKADAEIAAQTAESEGRITEIRDSAMQAVETVAKDTAQAIVATILPDAADQGAVDAAVADVLKGAAK